MPITHGEIKKRLQEKGLRIVVDESNEKMGYKIRQAQTRKVPYQIVVGDQEMADGTVNIRRYGSTVQLKLLARNQFIENIQEDVANYSRTK